jgi:hypothetical protein
MDQRDLVTLSLAGGAWLHHPDTWPTGRCPVQPDQVNVLLFLESGSVGYLGTVSGTALLAPTPEMFEQSYTCQRDSPRKASTTDRPSLQGVKDPGEGSA